MVRNSNYFCGGNLHVPDFWCKRYQGSQLLATCLFQQTPLTLRDQGSPLVAPEPLSPCFYETGTLQLKGRLHPAADSYLRCLAFSSSRRHTAGQVVCKLNVCMRGLTQLPLKLLPPSPHHRTSTQKG